MNKNTDNIGVLNISELLWKIAFGWRRIVCCGIVFMLVFGSIRYVKDMKSYQQEKNRSSVTETNDMTIEKQNLTKEQQQVINDVKQLEEQIEALEKYQSESVYMQINPYEENIAILQYNVDSDYTINYTKDNTRDYTDAIVRAYGNYLIGGEVSTKIIDDLKLDITTENFSELISTGIDETVIVIRIIYPEKEKLTEISEKIEEILKDKEKQLQSMGSHRLELLQKNQNTVVDKALEEEKNRIQTNLTNLKGKMTTLKAGMTEQQIQILEDETLQQNTEEKPQEIIKPRVNKKYMVLGISVGIMLGCIWIIWKTLCSGKLQTSAEIQNIFGICLLGELKSEEDKKVFGTSIDRKLEYLRNRKKKKLSSKQRIEFAAVNIELLCRKEKVKHIYITGSEYENLEEKLKEQLKIQLEKHGIEISEGNSIFYDVKSFREAVEVENILLVEKIGESMYKEIENEKRLADEQNVNILGAVICE